MARSLTPNDCYALMNLIVKEAIGADSTIQVVDSSSFVSAGETVLATGTENVLNAISLVIGRTLMAVRPYSAKLGIVNTLNTGLYSDRLRKISFYDGAAQASGAWNTDLYTNLYQGYDGESDNSNASVGGQYEQNLSVPLEINFAGSSVWDFNITIPSVQLQTAFRSESEFSAFMSGMLTKHANDIEKTKEAFNRMAVLNKIAGTYAMDSSMPGSVVNLTEGFNTRYGTAYSSQDLLTTYSKEFMAYFVEVFKLTSKKLTEDTTNFHWTPTHGSLTLSRHTPYSKQKVLLYEPYLLQAKTQVLPEIFNPEYLDIKTQYEGVLYWQNWNDPSAIKVIPAIPNVSDPSEQTKPSDPVDLPIVIGMIWDEDGLMTDYQFEGSTTTPEHARKRYRNIWLHLKKNVIMDNTENTVIFIMQDSSEP